jgi:hypothetical protein
MSRNPTHNTPLAATHSGQQVGDVLLDLAERDVEARRDDTGLVDPAVELDNDLAGAVVVDDLELADVAWISAKRVSTPRRTTRRATARSRKSCPSAPACSMPVEEPASCRASSESRAPYADAQEVGCYLGPLKMNANGWVPRGSRLAAH